MNQLPAYLQNKQPSKVTQNLAANLGSGALPYISIKGNKFTFIDSTGEEEPAEGYLAKPDQNGTVGVYIDVVLADFNEHTSKVYFEKAFDPNAESAPPDCWSDNGTGPSRQAAKPQHATCADCPKNQWGSAISNVSQKQVKACHDVQKIACVVPGDDILFQLRVPPNSRSNLRDYNTRFNGQPFDMTDVITRIWFDPGQLGTLKFCAVGFMDDATVALRDKALAEKKTDLLVGRGDLPRVEVLSPPAQQITISQVQPSVAPSPTQNVMGATSGAPFPAPEQPQPTRRKRRTQAQIAADNAAAANPAPVQATPQMAPFMPSGAPASAPSSAAPAPDQQPTNFGIQQGAAPNPEVMAALANVFGPQK